VTFQAWPQWAWH